MSPYTTRLVNIHNVCQSNRGNIGSRRDCKGWHMRVPPLLISYRARSSHDPSIPTSYNNFCFNCNDGPPVAGPLVHSPSAPNALQQSDGHPTPLTRGARSQTGMSVEPPCPCWKGVQPLHTALKPRSVHNAMKVVQGTPSTSDP
jgi:hypothetical protein